MSIHLDNKLPETEEDKQNMKQPYAAAKCPNKYISLYAESRSSPERIIGTAHAAFPKINRSVMGRIRALPSSLKSSRLTRSRHGSVCADSPRTSPSVTELTNSSNSDHHPSNKHTTIQQSIHHQHLLIQLFRYSSIF